jgi:UDP-N-acetylmuramate--alanine ligase
MAAVAVATELGVGFDQIAAALAEFRGVERRFQWRGEVGGVVVIDDYGHHPTEIAAVIAAARSALDRRIVVVFQPHRYTRTQQLLDRFAPALAGADQVVLTDIYAAGEDPIPGVTVETLAESIARVRSQPIHVIKSLDEIAPGVARLVKPGDVVITLGAGSIGSVAERILDELKKPGPGRDGSKMQEVPPCR